MICVGARPHTDGSWIAWRQHTHRTLNTVAYLRRLVGKRDGTDRSRRLAGSQRKSKNHERATVEGVQASSTNLQRRNQEVYRSCARQLTVDHHQRTNWAAMCGYIYAVAAHIYQRATAHRRAFHSAPIHRFNLRFYRTACLFTAYASPVKFHCKGANIFLRCVSPWNPTTGYF